jgi:hypothetical protein
MKTRIILQGVLVMLLASLGRAQQSAPAQSPSPADTSAVPAIVYSEMQEPVPQPAGQAPSEPIPPTQQQQPEDRPAPGRPPQSNPGAGPTPGIAPQDASPSFSGTIIKNRDQFVLRTQDHMNFQLDDQERAKKFAGTQVKVTGTVDSTKHKIHVEKIEPLV